MIRIANWMTRAPRVPVMRPALALSKLTSVSKSKLTWLKTLKNSARNSMSMRSNSRERLIRLKSVCVKLGELMPLRWKVPN